MAAPPDPSLSLLSLGHQLGSRPAEDPGGSSSTADDVRQRLGAFEPFESTTQEVDPVLGQGMGLGLTITRRILDYYGISVGFVEPDPLYSTAIEMAFPK